LLPAPQIRAGVFIPSASRYFTAGKEPSSGLASGVKYLLTIDPVEAFFFFIFPAFFADI
jgi:hypothetical protein